MMMWTLRFFSSSFREFLLAWQNPVYFILCRSRSEMNNNEMKSERIIQNDEYSLNRDMFLFPTSRLTSFSFAQYLRSKARLQQETSEMTYMITELTGM